MRISRLFNHKVLVAIDVTGSVSTETAIKGIQLCYKLQDNGIDTKYCCWDGACGPIKSQQTENLSTEFDIRSRGGAGPDCVFNALAERGAIVAKYKEQGKTDVEINELMKDYDHFSVPKVLSYLSGESFNGYLHDMEIVQEFAMQNRAAMLNEIVKGMGWKVQEQFTTVHNYIDTKNMILRKGSVSAQAGECLIIPMNMRDGSLICVGKGNADWNFSAPHGAGRLMSRADAKNSISMKDYKESMKGIYTSCVSSSTVDESPMAYKPMEEIIKNIEPTCEIEKIIKPVYNFKAAF